MYRTSGIALRHMCRLNHQPPGAPALCDVLLLYMLLLVRMRVTVVNPNPTTLVSPPRRSLADSHAPTWTNNLDGHVNLRDAVRRTIQYTGPNGKQYALRGDGKLATLLVR